MSESEIELVQSKTFTINLPSVGAPVTVSTESDEIVVTVRLTLRPRDNMMKSTSMYRQVGIAQRCPASTRTRRRISADIGGRLIPDESVMTSTRAFHRSFGHSSNSGNSSWRGSPFDGRDRLRLWRASESRLARPSATSRRIGQALALHAEERAIGPFQIINSGSDSIVVPEIELGGVTVQMSLGDVEIAAVDPALEDRVLVCQK